MGDLVEGCIVASNVDLNFCPRGNACVFQQLSGLGGVIGQGFHVRIITKGQGPLKTGNLGGLSAQNGINDGLAIHTIDHGFTHTRVCGDAFARVKTQGIDGRAGGGFNSDIRVFFNGRDHANRNGGRDDQINTPGLKFGNRCCGFSDKAIVKVGDFGVIPPKTIIGREFNANLWFIGHKAEWPGAHGVVIEKLLALFCDVLGGDNHCAIARQLGQENRIRLFQVQINRMIVNDLSALNGGVV